MWRRTSVKGPFDPLCMSCRVVSPWVYPDRLRESTILCKLYSLSIKRILNVSCHVSPVLTYFSFLGVLLLSRRTSLWTFSLSGTLYVSQEELRSQHNVHLSHVYFFYEFWHFLRGLSCSTVSGVSSVSRLLSTPRVVDITFWSSMYLVIHLKSLSKK